MGWKDELISLYLLIDDEIMPNIYYQIERHSNNKTNKISDAELITIYIFCSQKSKSASKKEMYNHAKEYLSSDKETGEKWFPNLPSYQAFNDRLNNLSSGFVGILEYLQSKIELPEILQGLSKSDMAIDSMPIIMAKRGRSTTAKVAREIADKGRCATKNMYYHGVKLHLLGLLVPGTIPLPYNIYLTKASENDNTVFKEQIFPNICDALVFADKAYCDKAYQKAELTQNVVVMAGVKKKKGQAFLSADAQLLNSAVSSNRQPIESFFNWLIETTNIQSASKVRSLPGLVLHIFAKLVLAFLHFTRFNY